MKKKMSKQAFLLQRKKKSDLKKINNLPKIGTTDYQFTFGAFARAIKLLDIIIKPKRKYK